MPAVRSQAAKAGPSSVSSSSCILIVVAYCHNTVTEKGSTRS